MNKNQTGSAVGTTKHPKLAVTFANGSTGFSDRSILDPKAWKKYSGVAPTSGIKVHTLNGQQIKGTESFAICREEDKHDGPMITATKAELEVLMTGLGYEITRKA